MNWLAIALLLLLVAIFFGLGFVVHFLFWIALVVAIVWLVAVLISRARR